MGVVCCLRRSTGSAACDVLAAYEKDSPRTNRPPCSSALTTRSLCEVRPSPQPRLGCCWQQECLFLCIQCFFSLRYLDRSRAPIVAIAGAGKGTVVTGTVLRGRAAVGDTVTLLSSATAGVVAPAAKVKGIQRFRKETTEARTGQRAAICLAGVDASQVVGAVPSFVFSLSVAFESP